MEVGGLKLVGWRCVGCGGTAAARMSATFTREKVGGGCVGGGGDVGYRGWDRGGYLLTTAN